jgi:hypothetical protein
MPRGPAVEPGLWRQRASIVLVETRGELADGDVDHIEHVYPTRIVPVALSAIAFRR